MTDIRQIERMTPYEFEIRMTAYQLKRLDEQETIHQQACLMPALCVAAVMKSAQ